MGSRHKWDRTGPRDGSKDVRTCEKCGVSSRKVGMYIGWELRVPEGPWMYFDRMQPCPWPSIGGDDEATT